MNNKERGWKSQVKLENAALDEFEDGEIFGHGWLDNEAMEALNVDSYQREKLEARGGQRKPLSKAIVEKARFPDIVVGMRGEQYQTSKNGDMLLEDPCFIIDGFQRISALLDYKAANPEARVRIGAQLRFNTNYELEKKLFTDLNTKQRVMSPNIIIRNERDCNEGVATLYGLSHTAEFPLYGKVCWDQQMARTHIITATSYVKGVATLHRHLTPGGRCLSNKAALIEVLKRQVKVGGLANYRKNALTFYEVIDQAWGIRGVKHQDRSPQLRTNFLTSLAGIFSDHSDFWEGNKLFVSADQRRKLKSFPVSDDNIARLASAGYAAGLILQRLMIDHLNKSKRAAGYLKLRPPRVTA